MLLSKGYEVHGIVRRSSSFNTGRIDHIFDKLHLHHGDLCDALSVSAIMREVQPHEVYNLAAQSHVKVSFEVPEYSAEVAALGTVRLLEAARLFTPGLCFYQASTSEMYGTSPPPQSEATPFRPCSPYAAAKLHAHWATITAREGYGLHASCGILFNHESERRGETFVTRKITRAAARIKLGLQQELRLGNLDACRDWGHARDYVEAMWLMLQQDDPDDYVIATGEMHSVREFLDEVFGYLDMDWRQYVKIDRRLFRPAEVEALRGDSSKARAVLGWEPRVTYKQLARLMVDVDLSDLRRHAANT